MTPTFKSEELARIIDQSLVFQCGCPAQVCSALIALRELHAYQMQCMNQTDTDVAVHEIIARAAIEAHKKMEECLTEILQLEGWDRTTLTMPDTLKKQKKLKPL